MQRVGSPGAPSGRSWRRVWADTEKTFDRFAGLRRIGIDEISYKRLTVVVDHDSGRLVVWAAPGRDTKTLRRSD
jgi:transposase